MFSRMPDFLKQCCALRSYLLHSPPPLAIPLFWIGPFNAMDYFQLLPLRALATFLNHRNPFQTINTDSRYSKQLDYYCKQEVYFCSLFLLIWSAIYAAEQKAFAKLLAPKEIIGGPQSLGDWCTEMDRSDGINSLG